MSALNLTMDMTIGSAVAAMERERDRLDDAIATLRRAVEGKEYAKPRWSQDVAARLEQTEVQLAGCATAAQGWSVAGQEAKPGDYGYSASYGEVLKLRRAFEKLAGGLSPDEVLGGKKTKVERAFEELADGSSPAEVLAGAALVRAEP